MRPANLNIDKSPHPGLPRLAALASLLVCCVPARFMAQQPGQKTFPSPEEASTAFVTAVQSHDEKAMLEILGPDGKQIISSGDAIQDAAARSNFVQRYQEMHRLVKEPDNTTTLYVGAKNWPIPIPLVNKGDSWYFDAEAGKKEIPLRRIGRNEMSTIRICQELVAAEKEYRSSQQEYARNIFSDEHRHNGLYWKAADGEPQSPIGPLVASAVAEGYPKGQSGAPAPYRGYYYRILTRQGKHAQGGAQNYIHSGHMTGGFAFVAYPAEYRSSGVMTFTVNQDGVIYQKDLGQQTALLVGAMTSYDPDSTWQRAELQPANPPAAPQPAYQVARISAVQSHRTADADAAGGSYDVSLVVGDTVYVVLYKPDFDTGTVPYKVGHDISVLVGNDEISFNDLLGNEQKVPILSRSSVTPWQDR